MIVPIIYPSAGEFWLRYNSSSSNGYSFENRKLTDLPIGYRFNVNSNAAREIAGLLNISLPLTVTAPERNLRRKTASLVVKHHSPAFSERSFVHFKVNQFDVYIASPELCFLQAARSLDMTDLVRFGYDLCSMFYPDRDSQYGQAGRKPLTTAEFIRSYIDYNHKNFGAVRAKQAARYIRDFSNSPMETKLAMFLALPENMGGCGITQFELNKKIVLTPEGMRLTGYTSVMGDLVISKARIDLEYNSNAAHLSPEQYTNDMNRQTALKLAGYDYIAITAGNIKNFYSLLAIIDAVRFKLGMKPLDEPNNARTELFFKLFRQG